MPTLREWIDRLLGTLRVASRRRRPRSRAAIARRRGRRRLRRPRRGDAGHGRHARSARPAVAARAVGRRGVRLAPAGVAAGRQRRRDPVARPGAGGDGRRLPAGGRRAAAAAADCRARAPRLRDDQLHRRPAARRLLRSLRLPDLSRATSSMVGDRADLLVVGSSGHHGGSGRRQRASRSASTGSSTRATSSACSACSRRSGRLLGPADDRAPGGHPVAVLVARLLAPPLRRGHRGARQPLRFASGRCPTR